MSAVASTPDTANEPDVVTVEAKAGVVVLVETKFVTSPAIVEVNTTWSVSVTAPVA